MKSYVSSALIVGSATGLQMVTPLGPRWAAERRCRGAAGMLRKDHPLAMVSAHGLLGRDLLADDPGRRAGCVIDQLRLVRSTLARSYQPLSPSTTGRR